MKQNILIFILIIFAISSCKKVINVDLNDADPKIVVDASVENGENYDGHVIIVKLSKSASFYDSSVPELIKGKDVYAINSAGKRFKLFENEYYYRIYIDEVDKSDVWKIETNIDGKDITAQTTMPNYVGIDSILSVKLPFGPQREGYTPVCFFTDIAGEANNYRLRIHINSLYYNDLYITRDDGFDGQQIAYPFMKLEVQKGDTVSIDLMSIDAFSLEYYKVFAQNMGGGGFSAAPGNPITNIVGEDAIGIFTGQTVSSVTRIVK